MKGGISVTTKTWAESAFIAISESGPCGNSHDGANRCLLRCNEDRCYKPEFHIYEHGGYGWSMRKQGTTSDRWLDEFYRWLEAHGLTKPSK